MKQNEIIRDVHRILEDAMPDGGTGIVSTRGNYWIMERVPPTSPSGDARYVSGKILIVEGVPYVLVPVTQRLRNPVS